MGTLVGKHNHGVIPFVDIVLEREIHSEHRPHELNPQLHVRCSVDLQLKPTKMKVKNTLIFLRGVQDNELSYDKVEY